MMANIWKELGSFSSILGYIPYNILLASENIQNEKELNIQARRDKFGIRNLLPAFGHIRYYFNVNKNGSNKDFQSESNTQKISSDKSNSKLTRNDLEQRLANKIQELKQNNVNSKRNKQNSKKLTTKTAQKAIDKKNFKPEFDKIQPSEPSFKFGRIIDSTLSTPSTADYLQKKESKMKKINNALNALKKEEELINSLPEEEQKAKIKEIAMEKAMKKAQGIKVKDNKSKLIKTKKTILAKKKKSRQKWAEISKNQKK
ncbi:Surfeit locus protein 6 [Cryptosporidium meleagridis]